MPITVKGVNASDRAKVIQAVETMPHMVEIVSVPLGTRFVGTADKLPVGVKVYAIQGKLKMEFWREGRHIKAA